MKQNQKNKTNFYTFVVAAVLVVASLSFFSSAEDRGEMQKSVFEDFDGDGLSNSEEESFGTDINNRDSDGDGYSDGVEIESGYDPLIPAPGDRIVQKEAGIEIDTSIIDDKNLTQKLSKELVEYIGDAKESGKEEISTEDLSELVSASIEKAISFEDIEIDVSEFNIKEQDYNKLSEKKRTVKEKEEIIEYFTAVSYVFMTNFPEGFFDNPVEEFAAEILQSSKNFSTDFSTGSDFFEELAEHAIAAEEEMNNIEVPESLVEIHFQGLYILRYIKTIYAGKEYENVEEDAMSMMVTLTKVQGLLDLTNNFIENVNLVMAEYEIEDSFLSF